jgi:DNA-binding response OmpR family regulator
MKKSVVIVEDDRNIAMAQKLILDDHFDVHVAHDGEEGLKLVHEKKPHLAILDVMMPKMDGFEVCKKIRESEHLQNTKVLMVTAKNQQRDEEFGMNVGADDYICKPFEPQELLHVVNQVLKE